MDFNQCRDADETRLARKIEKVGSDFGKDSYHGQTAKLKRAIDEFKSRVRPDELNADSAAGGAPAAAEAGAIEATSEEATTTTQQFRPVAPSGSKPITVDADIVMGKSVKSIEVSCRIEYS